MVIFVIGVGLVAAVLATQQVSRQSPPSALERPDRAASSFELPALSDEAEVVRLADYAGRPVVVNFWASWCVPCRNEMPALQRVHESFGDRVEFLGVNHQDNRDDALDLLAETSVTYPSGYDPKGTVARSYGVFGMPTTLFIDADGVLKGRRTGEMSERELEETIRDLLLP